MYSASQTSTMPSALAQCLKMCSLTQSRVTLTTMTGEVLAFHMFCVCVACIVLCDQCDCCTRSPHAVQRFCFGTVLENVQVDLVTRNVDYDDAWEQLVNFVISTRVVTKAGT
jgi:hypothetical protein